MKRKEEDIEKIIQFLRGTPNEFALDYLDYISAIAEKELGKRVKADPKTRESTFELLNNFLSELSEKSVCALSICMLIAFDMYLKKENAS